MGRRKKPYPEEWDRNGEMESSLKEYTINYLVIFSHYFTVQIGEKVYMTISSKLVS